MRAVPYFPGLEEKKLEMLNLFFCALLVFTFHQGVVVIGSLEWVLVFSGMENFKVLFYLQPNRSLPCALTLVNSKILPHGKIS